MNEIKPCPFCGAVLNIEDGDTLYPTGFGWKIIEGTDFLSYHRLSEVPREQWCWGMHCPNCSAEVNGDSEQEAIDNWNKRVDPQVIHHSDIQLKQRCETLVFALVGNLYDTWWSSPNKAFDGKTPDVMFEESPTTVYNYLMKYAYEQ